MGIALGISTEELIGKLEERIWAYEVNLMGLEKNLSSSKASWAQQKRRRDQQAILMHKLTKTEECLARLLEEQREVL